MQALQLYSDDDNTQTGEPCCTSMRTKYCHFIQSPRLVADEDAAMCFMTSESDEMQFCSD